MDSRAKFLSKTEHKIVFNYTPKHCSWLNQIEIWFSILMRKVLKRSSFNSQGDLATKILDVPNSNSPRFFPFSWRIFKMRIAKNN